MADLGASAGDWPVVNSVCLGALLLAVAGLFCAWLLQRPGQALHPVERWLAYLLLGWGVIWWGLGGLHEIDRRVRYLLQGNVALAFFTASCLSFGWLARRLAWPMTRYPALALLPLMVLVAMASADHDAHPFAHSRLPRLAAGLCRTAFSCCAGTKHPPAATWSGSTRWACGCSRRLELGKQVGRSIPGSPEELPGR
jgi:hypothetical protein